VAIAVRRMFTTNNPETILITRDPIVALLVSKRVDKILEIHHYPKGLNFLYCRLLNFKSRLFIATLTETHKELLMSLFKNKIIGIAPMGVPDEFFIDSHQNNSEICIGYIGKGWSSGEDNHLEDLIFCQDYLQKKFNLRTTLLFIGLELDYKSRLIDVYDLIDNPNKKAKFIDHVPHEALSDYLGLIDFGVLPYRESTYNAQRFPLKSLEYAASGISIVASNTKSHLNLLNTENSTFYESGNYVDLACKIFELNLNPEIAEDKRTIARFWAKNFSYKARAEAFLSLVMQ
jgi:glycosyltransferase involved in cell wall biosynthesis